MTARSDDNGDGAATAQTPSAAPPKTPSLASETPSRDPTASSSRVDTATTSTTSSVQVAVRVRPLLPSEAGTDNCVQVLQHASLDDKDHPSTIRIGGTSGPAFTFDHVFDLQAQQQAIYTHQVQPLVNSCLEGYNATIIAYGQTGSGKTYTIMGPSAATADQNGLSAGVIPRAVRTLFQSLQENSTSRQESQVPVEYDVRVQFLELYGEEIRDLLATGAPNTGNSCRNNSSTTNTTTTWSTPDKLTIRDIGNAEPDVVGATQRPVGTAEDALKCLTHGMLRRVTGATAMNESSSRSHAILSVLVEQSIVLETDEQGKQQVQVRRSKFNFVDLAGSERQKRTQAVGKRLREGIDINKGLLVLGNVISALGDPRKKGKTFVPYRDSKLTRLLKGSLGGNHKTLMIACVSPSSDNLDESLNCLRYANRAKNIQNNAVVNVDANSQRLSALKGQVQALAGDLIRAKDGDVTGGAFTRQVLEALAAGGEASGNSTASSPAKQPRTPQAGSSPHPVSAMDADVERRLRETEVELSRTRDLLRQSQQNHDAAEEQLYATKAEKQLYQLQVSVMMDDGSVPVQGEVDKQFLDKALHYEKEIGALRSALRTAETKAERMAVVQGELLNDETDEFSVEKAREALDQDRKRLSNLQSVLSSQEETDLESLATHGIEANESLQVEKASRMEAAEEQEEAELQTLTSKYLAQGGHVEDEDHTAEGATEGEGEGDQPPASPGRRQRHIQADLVALSRGISAKEDLIDQLKLSQEKYASMRDFYEDKLKRMEDSLRDKELEREQLARELDQTKDSGVAPSKELQDELHQKDKHIATLRKRQKELKDLTSVSSRNDSEITRLQTDVRSMKQKKVSLQKQMNEERKSHKLEVKRMQKSAMQKDRELNKWKNDANKKDVVAQKANQVAKARLEEIGHLRTKYKDTEKRLRTLSLKRGVMTKAGLDPVIIGRRDSERGKKGARAKASVARGGAAIDADQLRDHFDQKVAEVVRKEAIVDKLAQEWEDHFELTSKREELSLNSNEESVEASQSLSVQIRFKEDRIRHLAQRLGKQQESTESSALTSSQQSSFLYDDNFRKVCKGTSPDLAKTTATRILFGMIVRERRRIAALARTASSLDEKLQVAEKASEASEAALRSYMDDQRHEFAALSQAQQEQILALMDMVREDTDFSSLKDNFELLGQGTPTDSDNIFDPKLLILANERIHVLERQLQELQSESNANDSYRERLDELTGSLDTRTKECGDLQEELSGLRTTLRQIREVVSGRDADSADITGHVSDVLEIVDGALHPSHTPARPKRRSPRSSATGSTKSSRSFLSPRLKKHVELMHTSDSAEESNSPEWASDIMADLALIAEGKIPPSLGGSPTVVAAGSQLEETNVFDRLTDPVHFTGVQKQARSKKVMADKAKRAKSPVPGSHGQEERKQMSRAIANRLDKIVIPDIVTSEPTITPIVSVDSSVGADQPSSDSKSEHRSVFERLMSPSQYTGTQKGRFQKGKRGEADEADMLLDDLLDSDSERQDSASARDETARSMFTDYTEQDVFERLQRTATQSYALKHNGTMLPDASFYDGRGSASSLHGTPDERRGVSSAETATGDDSNSSDYTNLNVFERLQKTTTEAFAKKTNKAKLDETEGGA